MTIFIEIARVTLRGLLGRRRTILMLLLAGIPVLVGLLVRANSAGFGDPHDVGTTLEGLVVRIILPLVALVFGTAALGSELEDGTAVHLLTKPISRATIVLAKVAVAGTLTAALVVPSTVIAVLLLARTGSDAVVAAPSMAVGVLAGSYLYVAVFTALSVLTSRGLLLGLGYALIWEGLLAGVLPGTQVFSIREYLRGIVHLLTPRVIDSIVGNGAVLYAAVALAIALAIASYRLATYEVRGAD
jgi:ABC-2 type transport system permease protein